MPSTVLVAIWNCTLADDWQNRPMVERIAAFTDAVGRAQVKAATIAAIDRAQTVQCIFVAPEYAFADPLGAAAKPAQQTSTDAVATLINAAKALSDLHRGMILVPGTIAYKEWVASNYWRAWNASFACHRNSVLTRFEKRTGVGEVTALETAGPTQLAFLGGVGYGKFTLDGHSYGLEICKDATGGGTLPDNVDVHVVMGQGVGDAAIQPKGNQYLIVADPGNLDVLMRLRRRPTAAGTDACLHGVTQHYWTIILD